MKKIPLSQISSYVDKKLDQIVRVIVLEADQAIKENTPVDTGRLAMSWQIGENGDLSGKPAAKRKYSRTVTSPKGTNYIPGQEEAGKIYSIHNNLPYAEPLCMGTSLPPSWGGEYRTKKAKIGWFELIGKEVSARTDQLWNEVVRKP